MFALANGRSKIPFAPRSLCLRGANFAKTWIATLTGRGILLVFPEKDCGGNIGSALRACLTLDIRLTWISMSLASDVWAKTSEVNCADWNEDLFGSPRRIAG